MSAPSAASSGGRVARVRLLDGTHLAVSYGALTDVIPIGEILVVRAEQNATHFVTHRRAFKVRSPLRVVLVKLAGAGLVQLRRDVAVNSAKIRRVVGAGGHRLHVVLEDESSIDVGRTYQRAVRNGLRGPPGS